ncbi:MAG: FKBP-type peptidyl-prolyl cis-trans isomerase [Bacteroidota bacterium]|nr:FKBP-type peptidyl-prolyl cis-trans isomerase [Bacteroidota bacterium]
MVAKFLLPITAVVMLASCGGNSQFDGFTRAEETGIHYKFFKHNEDAKKIELGGGIKFSWTFSVWPKDSIIMESKQATPDGSRYASFGITPASFKGSFEDGLLMMHEGDSAAFIISADSFFLKTMRGNELPPGVKPGDFLKGVFAIKEVKTKTELEKNNSEQKAEYEKKMKEAMANESVARDKFLADNKITVKPTESGLIYVEIKKGKGEKPKPTDVVKVHYHGTFLDGTVFDSSVERKEPIEFPLNQVIQGWTEGLGMMSRGGKAKLIIPSTIAYGPQGRQGAIPPFSTLVFELELIDFKAAPTEQMQMPQQQAPGQEHEHHEGDGHKH